MKYIIQYIKKLCPSVEVTYSKTTESTYYDFGCDFVVRLSDHIGIGKNSQISITKAYHSDKYIVMVETSPFPLIKDRKEVKEFIRATYEVFSMRKIMTEHNKLKAMEELDKTELWGDYWSKVCTLYPLARFFTTGQKIRFKEYRDKGVSGKEIFSILKDIKPTTELGVIDGRLKKALLKKVSETEK